MGVTDSRRRRWIFTELGWHLADQFSGTSQGVG